MSRVSLFFFLFFSLFSALFLPVFPHSLLFKIHGQHPVGLVHDQVADRAEREALGVLEVVDHAPGRGDNDVRLARQCDALLHDVHSADNDRTLHADRGS